MADGTEKPIEDVRPGDEVMAFDPRDKMGMGKTVPRKVTRLFRNTTKTIINLRGLKMTPGHIVLCDNGEWLKIADALRQDRALIEERQEEPVLVRARTGATIGSLQDTAIRVTFSDRQTGVAHQAAVRAGIAAIAETRDDGTIRLWTLAEVLLHQGYSIAPDGVITRDGMRYDATPWPGVSPLEAEMMLNWVVAVDGKPFTPPWIVDIADEEAKAMNASPRFSASSPPAALSARAPNRAERRRRASLRLVT